MVQALSFVVLVTLYYTKQWSSVVCYRLLEPTKRLLQGLLVSKNLDNTPLRGR